MIRGEGIRQSRPFKVTIDSAYGGVSKDQGPRTMEQGPCFGMNEHPGRDADVISRPVQIYNLRSIILYRLYTDRIKDQGSWTLPRILDLVFA